MTVTANHRCGMCRSPSWRAGGAPLVSGRIRWRRHRRAVRHAPGGAASTL